MTCVSQHSSRSKVDGNSATATIDELEHMISSMRDQQMHLLKALKECSLVISNEMLQMQHKGQDSDARSDQAESAR